jgi:hypothetical protein
MKLSLPFSFSPLFHIFLLAVADKDAVVVSGDYTRHVSGYSQKEDRPSHERR